MNHHSNQISGSISSGNYARENSGMSHHSNQMLGSTSSGRYGSGSAHRNMHQSTGTESQRSMNMRSSSLSSGSQPIPEIGYLEEEISEAVVGAGLVGALEAIYLAERGAEVHIYEYRE